MMKRKDRKSTQKITEKSSEENEEIAGSTKDVPKETCLKLQVWCKKYVPFL